MIEVQFSPVSGSATASLELQERMESFLWYPAATANFREAVVPCAKTGLDPLTGGSPSFSNELVENKHRLRVMSHPISVPNVNCSTGRISQVASIVSLSKQKMAGPAAMTLISQKVRKKPTVIRLTEHTLVSAWLSSFAHRLCGKPSSTIRCPAREVHARTGFSYSSGVPESDVVGL